MRSRVALRRAWPVCSMGNSSLLHVVQYLDVGKYPRGTWPPRSELALISSHAFIHRDNGALMGHARKTQGYVGVSRGGKSDLFLGLQKIKHFPYRRLSHCRRCTGDRFCARGTRAICCTSQTHPHAPSVELYALATSTHENATRSEDIPTRHPHPLF